MVIEKILFNGKQYFEGQMPDYIGKKFIAPKKAIHGYIALNTYVASQPGHEDAMVTPKDIAACEGTVYAQGINRDPKDKNIYLLGSNALGWWISLNELIQNGGVSSNLNHVSPLRKELNVIKEILFNKQKYFEGQIPNYIGKKISMTQETANHAYELYSGNRFLTALSSNRPIEGVVKGQIKNDDHIYVFIGSFYDDTDVSKSLWYDINDVKIQNGGVTSLLNRISRGLRSLLRNEVIACL